MVGEVLSIVRYLWGSLRVHLKVRVGAPGGREGWGGVFEVDEEQSIGEDLKCLL